MRRSARRAREVLESAFADSFARRPRAFHEALAPKFAQEAFSNALLALFWSNSTPIAPIRRPQPAI